MQVGSPIISFFLYFFLIPTLPKILIVTSYERPAVRHVGLSCAWQLNPDMGREV